MPSHLAPSTGWPNFADLLGGLNGWTELASIDPAAVTEMMAAVAVEVAQRQIRRPALAGAGRIF